MNETVKPKLKPYDRRTEADRYIAAIRNLVAICEENVENAFARDNQMDIIITQKQLIAALKLAGNTPIHLG
jgi:hypothetical protein